MNRLYSGSHIEIRGFLARLPDGGAFGVAGEQAVVFHLAEDAPDGLALSFLEGKVGYLALGTEQSYC